MEIGHEQVNASLSPEGESLRKAVRWLSARLADGHPASLKLVAEAALRFDLSPLEEEFLRKEWLEGDVRP
jgi:hypothetical protein